MIKKLIISTGVMLILGLFFFGRDMASYVRTSAGVVKDSVQSSVPIEFQIERARGMIDGLVPEIRKNMHVIAKEEVEIAQLEEQIADAEGNLGQDKDELVRLQSDLGTDEQVFQYAGRSYSAEQVKVDLSRRFERYKTNEATLASLHEIHGARQRSLEAARDKLEGMLASKRQLEVDVENIEAKLEVVNAAQATAEYNFDDSKLGRVKELVTDLRTRLDVASRLVNAEDYFHDEIPLEGEAPDDIADQVADYFGTSYFGASGPDTKALAQE